MTNAITATAPISTSQTMSSLEIAKLTGKQHKEVLRDIRNILAQVEIDGAQFCAALPYGKNGNTREVFSLPRLECDLVISGYSVKYRLAIIKRWHELETKQAAPIALPSRISTVEDRKALNDAVRELPQVSALTFSQAWKIVHQYLKIDSIEKATVDQIDSALQYVHTLRVQGFEASTLVKQIEAPSGSIATLTSQVNKGNGYPDELLMPLYAQLIVRFAPRHMLISKDRYADLFKDAIRIKEVGEKLISRVNMLGMMDCDINDSDWQRHFLTA